MAKYIKQELPDMDGSGKKRSYYRMQRYNTMDTDTFIERMMSASGFPSKGVVRAVIANIADTMADVMAMGHAVNLEGIGIFNPTIGLKKGRTADDESKGRRQPNASDLEVKSVNFKPDRSLVSRTAKKCSLEKGGVSHVRRSPYTKEQRLQMALDYIDHSEHHAMRLYEYANITGLSMRTASRELKALCRDPASGLGYIGRGPTRMFVRKKV